MVSQVPYQVKKIWVFTLITKINFSTFFGTLALERSDGRLTKFEE